MVRVMASGVFDIIHLGHVYFLKEAKKLGDELVVVVATDKTAEKNGKNPINTQDARRELVSNLRFVDRAEIGSDEDMFETVADLKPDIIAIGHDQSHDPDTIKEELAKRDIRVDVIRVPKWNGALDGTRKIIRKAVSMYKDGE